MNGAKSSTERITDINADAEPLDRDVNREDAYMLKPIKRNENTAAPSIAIVVTFPELFTKNPTAGHST